MATNEVKRKLTAIFSADVEGYSRLMGDDELATVETLTLYKQTMRKLIRQYRGRVVDSTGDNLLAEFASVVDAVQCAVEVQQILNAKNEYRPENRRMRFRIGINLGDVIEEDDRIFGDGVNIAARVESLAEGGGISLSGTAYDQLGKKLPLGYEYLGEQSVKNIEKPVRVYRILTEAEAAGKVIGELKPKTKQLRGATIGGFIVIILVAAVLAIWNFYFRPAFEPASVEKMAFPLPDKPSIAVLPFDNLSGDPKQEYIADGITQSISTALSNIPEIFVSAYNRFSPYKGKPIKLQEVAHDLGVRYLLNGSTQKSGDKIRINAQLVDVLAGRQLWSEKYDSEMKDFLQILDEITLKIVIELQVKLTHGEQARKWYGTTNLEAWGYLAKGAGIFEIYTKPNNEKARELFEKALKIDPENAHALVMLAWTHYMDARLAFTKTPSESIKEAMQFAKKALSIDDKDTNAHALLGSMYLIQRQYEKAIAEGQKSIELGPNSALSYALFSQTMYFTGNFDEAIASAEEALRLAPNPPVWYMLYLGRAYTLSGRYQDALEVFEKMLERAQKGEYPLWMPHASLTITYSMMGQTEKAQIHLAETQKLNRKFSLEYLRKTTFHKDPADLERSLNALRKVGLTDEPPLPLPDKPSIAVLPFTNMSGDPTQEYFSDGLTENIITRLARNDNMFVIARNSSFVYKGKPVDARQIGRDLGVRYILEGGVQKGGERFRITAKLIDAATGKHLWADSYDRELKDFFPVMDEITQKILTELAVKLTFGEGARKIYNETDNFAAFDFFLKGVTYWKRMNKESNQRAKQLFAQAIELDPNYSRAIAFLGWSHMNDYRYWGKDRKKSFQLAEQWARRALAIDDTNGQAHQLLGRLCTYQRKYAQAIAEGERAVEVEPSISANYTSLALTMLFAGKPEEALVLIKRAMRLSPYPNEPALVVAGMVHFFAGRFEEGIPIYREGMRRKGRVSRSSQMLLIASYVKLGREDDARAEAKKFVQRYPEYSLKRHSNGLKRVFKDPAMFNPLIEALRKAGMPEKVLKQPKSAKKGANS
ncbi:tetratricopeptide repeat protein [Thermodesulfobacteriota bacterium]